MKQHFFAMALAALAQVTAAAPASAEIIESETGGFASSHSAIVAADRAQVWRELLQPEHWWSHTWSDDSANLHLDPHAGGCFCETIPSSGEWAAGSVEHMRVVMVLPGSVLRMSGSLGPLQSEALAGTLTVTLTDVVAGDGGTAPARTQITWDYIAGGEARFQVEELGPVVDSVQAEFLAGLVARLGGAVDES